MAKKLFKEEQKYHDFGVIALVTLLSVALVWRIGASLANTAAPDWGVAVPLLLIFALVWMILLKLRLKIKISESHIRLSLNPFVYPKMKLPWSEVKAVAFFRLSEVALLSGHAVHFNAMEAHFGLGDKSGMVICTHDGKEYMIFSSSLYRNREEIKQQLVEAHPGLNVDGCSC